MSKDWNPEWNGHTELWDENITCKKVCSPVKFNHAIIFQTNNLSWHGLTDIIKCPPGAYRKSIAYYYVSDFEKEIKVHTNSVGCDRSGYRIKAVFRPTPGEEIHPGLEELYKIRPFRRITDADILKYYPQWLEEQHNI
jgi:hypothetical protein